MALVAHTIAGSANLNTVTTSAIDTTGATLLVVVLSEAAGVTAPSPTDSKSNTWTALTKKDTNVTAAVQIFYVENPTVGSGHTASFTHNSQGPALAFLAFDSTLTASVFDAESGTFGNGSETSLQPGSITPAIANSVLVTGIGFGASRTLSIGSSFTIADQLDYLAAGGNMGLAVAYKISSSAENPTWSWSPAATMATAMAAFKSGAPAGRITKNTRAWPLGMALGMSRGINGVCS